jgi:hypothetical protein
MIETRSMYSFGNKTGRGKKYTSPSNEDRINTRLLSDSLKNFDGILTDNLSILVEKLDLDIFKIEEKENCYAFVPKQYGQYCIFINTSDINFPEKKEKSVKRIKIDDTIEKCIPFMVSYPHSGQDNVDRIGYYLFLNNNYKCLIINGYHPNKSNEPSPYQKGRKISNADHSPNPSMNDFVDQFINHTFPNLGVYVLHGMSSNKKKKVWFISSTGKNIKYNQRNINFFMTIAWALNSKSNKYFGQTNNKLDKFYTLRNDGTKKFLTSDNETNCYFKTFRGPTSSVSSHIANYGEISKKIGTDSGRTCHAEHAISTIGHRPQILSEVHKQAMEWYILWNNDLHKFENVPKNLEFFDTWMKNPQQLF